jgi:hypothetical protein
MNKRTRDVVDKLAALRCDPIAGMARIAVNKKNPIELRFVKIWRGAHIRKPLGWEASRAASLVSCHQKTGQCGTKADRCLFPTIRADG